MAEKNKDPNQINQLKKLIGIDSTPYLSGNEYLLELGTRGYYPLFYPDWIQDSLDRLKTPISLTKARANVKKNLELLDRHQSYERKRIAVSSMSDDMRDLFIRSFIRIVENKLLDKELTNLH